MTERGALTSVLVADDHPAVVEAVADVPSEHGIEVAGRARDGDDAVEQIELRKPTVAILDLRMPGQSGIEVARLVARTAPGTAVILSTTFGDRPAPRGTLSLVATSSSDRAVPPSPGRVPRPPAIPRLLRPPTPWARTRSVLARPSDSPHAMGDRARACHEILARI